MKCFNSDCKNEAVEDLYYCLGCEVERYKGFRETWGKYQGIGLSGVSDGPGSGSTQICFDKPNRYLETRDGVRKMYEHGEIKTPEQQATAEYLWKSAEKYKDIPKVDYQVDGHPMYGGRSKSMAETMGVPVE